MIQREANEPREKIVVGGRVFRYRTYWAGIIALWALRHLGCMLRRNSLLIFGLLLLLGYAEVAGPSHLLFQTFQAVQSFAGVVRISIEKKLW